MSGVSVTIAVQNLSCSPALAEISFQVGPGEVLALVGSQGSGKTTLIQILAGQRAPSGGSATVAGVDCQSPGIRRMVGVAGGLWDVYARMTVWENLLLFTRLWGLPAARIADVLKITDLTGLAWHRAERLRPGETARLRLARALLHDPPALLLDEPIGDVDRESASVLYFAIAEAAEQGKAVLLTTFGHPKALDLATRLAYLEDGRLAVPAPAAQPAQAADQAAAAAANAAVTPPPIRHIAARRGERVVLLAPEEIRYAYAQEKSVFVQTAEGPCTVSFTLADLEERLAGQAFFRCHRGFLVNLGWVKEIAAWTRDSYSLILKDGTDIPLSKHRARELRSRLGW